ncbi:MAG: hypothetical protein IBX72_12285 [Nitrospirae bacterium]|nr:hypothetical protein [Nitrospirota bacterium]
MIAKKRTWFYKGYFGFIKGRTSQFRDYVLEIESKFSHDLKSLEKRHEKEIRQKGTDAEFEDYLTDFYAEEFHRIDRIFLRTFRYSAVVTIYSLLETSMNSLCSILKQMKGINIELEEIRGDGIERAKVYLKKACGIKFPERSHAWSELQKLNKIRNCIIHAEGDIWRTHSPTKLNNILKNTKGLALENDQYLLIEKKFLEDAITWAEDFLQELHENSFPDK